MHFQLRLFILKNNYDRYLVSLIERGGVAVIPTDTIYGIIASAWNKDAVERVYKIKERNKNKPFIILISSFDDLKEFSIEEKYINKVKKEKIWPGPVSAILPCNDKNLKYLHRDKNTLAFRLPSNENLKKFISKTGPLVAPSANKEGEKPAQTISQAKRCFGGQVDRYIDGGEITGLASKIIDFNSKNLDFLR